MSRARFEIFTRAEVAPFMQEVAKSDEQIGVIDVEVEQVSKADAEGMVLVTGWYDCPQDLFLFGMLTTKAWAEHLKAAQADDELFNHKFRG